ncbi:MAG: hypothetical protein QNJ61_18785, partial [Desulfobacterales bacterium]|nr:hypothetical protein [Desulfobacterales bacterium]
IVSVAGGDRRRVLFWRCGGTLRRLFKPIPKNGRDCYRFRYRYRYRYRNRNGALHMAFATWRFVDPDAAPEGHVNRNDLPIGTA